MQLKSCILFLALVMLNTSTILAEQFTVGSFNLHSENADINELMNQLKDLDFVDVWGLSEVNPQWKSTLETELPQYQFSMGSTGDSQRLIIAYKKSVFSKKAKAKELHAINSNGNVRAPLVMELKTKSGTTHFLFMVNHLYRSKDYYRYEQARGLNEWGGKQTKPVIAVGDYNFDWSLNDGTRDKGFNVMIRNDVFKWVLPEILVKSHCSVRYNSILDFIFVSGDAQQWDVLDSKILFTNEGYCKNQYGNSDHRPVIATFSM